MRAGRRSDNVDGRQRRVALALVAIGVAFRLAQYLARNSLWIDEAALARNIVDRPFTGLLRPLDYAQVAPIGFLLVEKAAVVTLGSGELALRAFPLACGIASIFLFRAVASRLFSGWTAVYAVGLFSLAVPAIYFSSQVKQYSVDALASIVILLASIDLRSRGVTPRGAVRLGLVGLAAVWFSQPAVFVLAGIGAAFAVLTWLERDGRAARRLAITWCLWASACVAASAFAFATVTRTDREFLRAFWIEGFMPMPPHNAADLFWIFTKLTWAFGAFGFGMTHMTGGLNYRWSYVFTALAMAGWWALWRTRRDALLFLVMPIAVVVGLSALSIYPFTARLVTFLVPYLLLAVAAGTDLAVREWSRRISLVAPAVLAIAGGSPLYAAIQAHPPVWLQHTRPIFASIAERRQPDDAVYVYFGAGQAYRYYAPRVGLTGDVRIGRCAIGHPRDYLRDLDALRGRARVWIIVTHPQRGGAELDLIREYLDAIGRRMETMAIEATSGRPLEGAWGYLYDLSDPRRLDRASADTYPISGVVADPPGEWSCYGVFESERKSAS